MLRLTKIKPKSPSLLTNFLLSFLSVDSTPSPAIFNPPEKNNREKKGLKVPSPPALWGHAWDKEEKWTVKGFTLQVKLE